jgi:hypothetical protein
MSLPDPPAVHWNDAQAAEIAARVAKFKQHYGEPSPEQMADLIALTTRPTRPYRDRYAGIRRQICRNNNLNPIRDRELIDRIMLTVVMQAKQIKRQTPRSKYRNIQILEASGYRTVVQGVWTSAGPQM